ncbi:GGDEF domain-containing protein [Salinisphaera sp. T31B1]|uniref:GGDEF domain-containing protein n=1 Tax=Salinisphaera sp. T31B1 TaxID=727963 RepID=UPI00334139DF
MKTCFAAMAGWSRSVVVGEAETPAHRMHLMFLFAVALGCFAGAALNHFGAITPHLYVLLLALVGLIVLGMWWYARRHEQAQQVAVLFCAAAVFAILPLNWIFNQGVDGPSLMILVVVVGYAFGALVIRPWKRVVLMACFVIVPSALIYAELRWPEWISPYPTRQLQAVDTAMTYYICVALQFALISGFFRRFRSEQRLIQEYAEQLREASRLDSLTGLLNHGAFYSNLEAALSTADRHQAAALVLYDLDHFKRINDTYGHLYGDHALREFARLLDQTVEAFGGSAGRCGGEEFAVLLHRASWATVQRMDQTLRDRCAARPMTHGIIRVSGGVAFSASETPTRWMERADRTLYAAKTEGRDRTLFAAAETVGARGDTRMDNNRRTSAAG